MFCICDRDMGIPPEAQPHLFEPFWRVSNTDNIAGTGLGLTIVKRCVERHSGQITLKSAI